MKRVRWIVAMMLILTMVLVSGCSGREDGRVNDNVIDDGTIDQNGSTYNHRNHNGNGGILSDIADDMEDGIDRIKDGMDTVEDDVRTDLGTNGGTANGSGSMRGN